jgi:hypothetical protein
VKAGEAVRWQDVEIDDAPAVRFRREMEATLFSARAA